MLGFVLALGIRSRSHAFAERGRRLMGRCRVVVIPDSVPRECITVRRTPEQRYTTARIDVTVGSWKVVALRFHRSAIDKVAYTYFNGPRKGSPVWELYVVTDGYLEEFVRYAEPWEAEHLDRAVADKSPTDQRDPWESYIARRAS